MSEKCNCGAEAVYHYCKICWQLEINAQMREPVGVVCDSCSAEILPHHRHCWHCGEPVNGTVEI